MRFVIRFTSLILFTTAATAHPESMSLSDFIQAAEQNDPRFANIEKQKQRILFLSDQLLPNRVWQTEFSNENGFGQNGQTMRFTGEVKKEVAETGTAFSVRHHRSQAERRSENITELRVEQDVYRNQFGRNYDITMQNVNSQQLAINLEVEEQSESYLESIILEYFSYKKLYTDVKLTETALVTDRQLLHSVQEKFHKKIAAEVDVDRARMQVLITEEALLEKKRLFRAAWENIRSMTGVTDLRNPEDDTTLLAEMIGVVSETPLEEMRRYRLAQMNQQTLRIQMNQVRQTNQPKVALVAGFNYDRSSGSASPVNEQEPIIGITVNYPIGDSHVLAEIRSLGYEMEKSDLDIAVLRTEISRQLNSIKGQLETLREQIRMSRQKIYLAAKIRKVEQKRYDIGKVEIERLIDLSNQITQFRLRLENEILEHNKLYIRWLSESDRLLEKRRDIIQATTT